MFDLLELDGARPAQEPLQRRKARPAQRCSTGAPDAIRYSEHVVGARRARCSSRPAAAGLEGIVSKRADTPYVSQAAPRLAQGQVPATRSSSSAASAPSDKKARRSPRCCSASSRRQDCTIAGASAPASTPRRSTIWAASSTGCDRKTSPFVDAAARHRPRRALGRAASSSPRLPSPSARRDGVLRHPAFLGLREDKPAQDVHAPTVTPVTDHAMPRPTTPASS